MFGWENGKGWGPEAEHLRLINYILNIQYFTEIHVVLSELRPKTFSNTKLLEFLKKAVWQTYLQTAIICGTGVLVATTL